MNCESYTVRIWWKDEKGCVSKGNWGEAKYEINVRGCQEDNVIGQV